jgi:hypothetical protein
MNEIRAEAEVIVGQQIVEIYIACREAISHQ